MGANQEDEEATDNKNSQLKESATGSEDKETTGLEKERKGNDHEHSFKTPVAKPDSEELNQSKSVKQGEKENQSSK